MLNKVMIIGRLGKDPEIRRTAKGEGVCNVSIATDSYWTDRTTGEKRNATEWHKVVFWGRSAENVAQYLRKGSLVYVEGRLQTRTWQSQDNVTHYVTEIIANEVKFLEPRPRDAGYPPGAPQGVGYNNYGANPGIGGQQPYPPQPVQPMPVGGAPGYGGQQGYPFDTATDLAPRAPAQAAPQSTTTFTNDLAGDDVPF